MTDKTLTISEVDCSTGIQVERPMTPEEVANFEAMRAELQSQQAEEEKAAIAKVAAKASAEAKLAALGLTAEEIAAL
jgi:dephospho-CoA kinase